MRILPSGCGTICSTIPPSIPPPPLLNDKSTNGDCAHELHAYIPPITKTQIRRAPRANTRALIQLPPLSTSRSCCLYSNLRRRPILRLHQLLNQQHRKFSHCGVLKKLSCADIHSELRADP